MPFTAPKAGDPCGHAAMRPWWFPAGGSSGMKRPPGREMMKRMPRSKNPNELEVRRIPFLGLRYHQKHSSIYVVCIKNLIWI